mmetsp:Transcript_26525/g.37241  ORF Transcript_26525/g.37241 Transcript_26525/m.37241 type:complete len:85 (-) Transcript_26525:434-688(-)
MCIHARSLERPNIGRLVIKHVDLGFLDSKLSGHPPGFSCLATPIAAQDILRYWNVWSGSMMCTDSSHMTISAAPCVEHMLPKVR